MKVKAINKISIVKNNIIIVSARFNQLQMIHLKIFFVDDSINSLVDWEGSFVIPYCFGIKESNFDKVESLDESLNFKK